jgi:hypothetical protein
MIAHVDKAYHRAESRMSGLTQRVLSLDGMSGDYTRHFYNNLCAMPDARYLEIGTWKGSSIAAAMENNAMPTCVCIDNWSEFGGPKKEFEGVFNKFRGRNSAAFYEADCWSPSLIESLKPNKFNIYMYDGNHSEQSHYNALIRYLPCLDDTFIFVVDDWNDPNVRHGTFRAIQDAAVDVIWKQETRLTWDDSHTPMDMARKTWWNGIAVFVMTKRGGE